MPGNSILDKTSATTRKLAVARLAKTIQDKSKQCNTNTGQYKATKTITRQDNTRQGNDTTRQYMTRQ